MKRPSEEALMLAAKAWCTPETENIELDSRLVIAFANILDEHNFINQLKTEPELKS